MIFSTYHFILLFLPAVFIVYSGLLALNKLVLAKSSLVVFSLFFYAYGSGDFFPFFVASVLFNFVIGSLLAKVHSYETNTRSKTILLFGILVNIALLGYYKYTDFIIFNINTLTDTHIPYQNIILPIGISFFTFQLIAYLVDSYRGETKDYGFLNYLLFITFFPQLIVGPIVHHKDVVPQYEALNRSWLNFENFSKGIFLFAIGCTKKLLMADPMTEWAQNAFDHALDLNMLESWFASTSYTLSYYFDLSAYADMAIGLGIMFGITIPANFNSPYKSRNFAEYWRRWHMTLSRFLGDYIFRNIYKKGDSSRMFYFAIFITFLVSGFWHGSGWTFVVWGVVNGLFVISSHVMTRNKLKLPFIIAWSMTFLGVIGTRILFVSNDFSDASHVLSQMVNLDAFVLGLDDNPFMPVRGIAYLCVGLFIVFFLKNSTYLLQQFKPDFKYAIATSALITLSFLNMSYVRGFLYFQF